jgi:SPP1 gp7 family putative phage head morphogenesis protein
MDTQISRVLSQAMLDGKHPYEIAKLLTKTISGPMGNLGITDTLGRFIPAERRAKMLARTEIIRAHHLATVQEYRNWGLEGVRVQVEWQTAGDPRVCEKCAELNGKKFILDEIEGKIPLHPNCFLDRQIPIYTSTGWKPIGDIAVGDYVLSHKGRFCKVYKTIHTPRQLPEAVRLKLHGIKNGGVSITANHPVLVTSKDGKLCRWKEAGRLREGNNIQLLASRCKRCGKLIPYFREYCSQTCLSLDITDRQWADPKHRELMSKKASAQLNREYASGSRDRFAITKEANKATREMAKNGTHPFQRADVIANNKLVTNLPHHCEANSVRMKKNNPMHDPGIRKKATVSFRDYLRRHPERKLNARLSRMRWDGKMTSIEKKMAELLDKLGIEYVFQYRILNYYADFAIPSLRIVIECDSDFWHQDKSYDRKRQLRIEGLGWFVLRYTDEMINAGLDSIEDELSRVFMNHNGEYEFIPFKVQAVRAWQVARSRTLYNLSVEEDESYIAKGMVVHNCRCVALPLVEDE